MPRTPDLVVESRSRLGRNEQATVRVQDRKVVANEVVAILSNAQRNTGIFPDSSFALPGTLSQHAVEVQFGPAGLARPPAGQPCPHPKDPLAGFVRFGSKADIGQGCA